MSPEFVYGAFAGIVFGAIAGGMTAWNFARKLEYHGVKLKRWDETDLKAQRPAEVTSLSRRTADEQ